MVRSWSEHVGSTLKSPFTNFCLEISAAYEVLSDEDKRQTYDRFGLEGLKEGRGGPGGFGGDDLFSMFFGGGSPFGKCDSKAR